MELLGSRYRIVSPLGAGGMGEVFLADDLLLERRVAIKFVHPDHEHDSVARERLRREALAAAALDHPFICKIYEIGDTDGRTFIVMEHVEGETLHLLARRELLPLRQIVEIANELAQALEEAHGRGIVHRDLKPANVMVTRQGHVKVLDFGLAKQSVPGTAAGMATGASTALTGSGSRLGTPAYMSPEQVVGGSVDARSDMFSLGVMLRELTTGVHPFLRDDPSATMTAILRELPASGPRDVESLPGFHAVTTRMLAKACADRFQTMSELRMELEALRDRVWRSGTGSEAMTGRTGDADERTPFVARSAETAELSRLLDRMLAGHGGLALIGGEPGVGKTRLARELLRAARQRGCLCLTGHSADMEGAAPFAPFIEATEQAVRSVPQAVRAAMGELASDIAVVVPSLHRAYTDVPPAADIPLDQQRRLVFSAYLEYVRRSAQQSPTVLLLDDLHWADESSLQLLSHLAPHLASMRLLLVGTYRDVELDVNRPFARTLEMLLRQRLATRIALRRLNESGVHHMLSAMHGSAPPSDLAKIVFRETEGNPFFVEEVYQHLAEEGKLFDEGGRWRENLRVDAIDVPEGVRLVIGRRLDRLGAQARKILTAAAVVGRSFPLDLLNAIVDVPEDGVLDAVEEAERAQLATSYAGVREARYEFVHELIRTTLVNGLSLPRRQRLHLRIADALERLRGSSLESHASVLAHHLYQAGAAADVGRTARCLALAARRALVAGAFEEVLELIGHVDSLELPDDDPLTGELLDYRGRALVGLHRLADAVAPCDGALAWYEARHDAPGIMRASWMLSNVLIWSGRGEDSPKALQRGIRALSPQADVERTILRSRLAATFAGITGQLPEAADELHDALDTVDRLTDRYALAMVALAQGFYHSFMSNIGVAAEAARRALEALDRSALEECTDALVTLGVAAIGSGAIAGMDSVLSQIEVGAERTGSPRGVFAHAWLSTVVNIMRTGNLQAFVSQTERAWSPVLFHKELRLATGLVYLGRIDEGVALITRHAGGNALLHEGAFEANLFVTTALSGQREQARRLFQAVEPKLPVAGQLNLVGRWQALVTAVLGLALIDDRERCSALYPLTLELAATGTRFADMMMTIGPSSTQLAAGISAHAAGLDEKAREHFETARREAWDMPHRLVQPSVLYWHGRMLMDQADSAEQARGRAMIQTAADDFAKLEMVLHARLASDSLR